MMSNQETQPTNVVNISDKQVAQISATALDFFRMKTTLIPGNIRRQLDVLEAVLTGLASGKLVVASPAQLAVELTTNEKIEERYNATRTDKTPQAEAEKRGESTRQILSEAVERMAQADSSAGSDEGASGAERTGSGSASEA